MINVSNITLTPSIVNAGNQFIISIAAEYVSVLPLWSAVKLTLWENQRDNTWNNLDDTIEVPTGGIPLSELSVGSTIKDINSSYYGLPIIWRIVDKDHTGYPSNSITLISDNVITLKALDAKEPSNTDSPYKRGYYGNNNYILSNIHQWLNSDLDSWYTSQHIFDAPPIASGVSDNPYDLQSGFLKNFSQAFKNILLNTETLVALNTTYDTGLTSFTSKIFLPSLSEIGGVSTDGSIFPYFTSNNLRKSYPTQAAVSNSVYTNVSFASNLPWQYWLRTPTSTNEYRTQIVTNAGGYSIYTDANKGFIGVRPVCNIPNSARVLEEPDIDGCYILSF